MSPDSFPEFRVRAPWWGPDLQTVRNLCVPWRIATPDSPSEALLLPLDDDSGDALAAALSRTSGADRRPLVVLIHGLSGSQESAYMQLATAFWLRRGHAVLRLNLRGAGPSREHCRLQYHAGRTVDLRDALRSLERDRPELLGAGLILVGYSLGGNMLLKFLAEFGDAFPIIAAASVSAPIDLAAASRRILERRNRIYHDRMLHSMKLECFGGPASLSEQEKERVLATRTIFEFDDHFVAPRNGFRGAEDYYERNHARRFLSGIRTPTLVIHALDDPWIPADAYLGYPWRDNPVLLPLLPRAGGHVGFHDRTRSETWHDRCIGIFVDQQEG